MTTFPMAGKDVIRATLLASNGDLENAKATLRGYVSMSSEDTAQLPHQQTDISTSQNPKSPSKRRWSNCSDDSPDQNSSTKNNASAQPSPSKRPKALKLQDRDTSPQSKRKLDDEDGHGVKSEEEDTDDKDNMRLETAASAPKVYTRHLNRKKPQLWPRKSTTFTWGKKADAGPFECPTRECGKVFRELNRARRHARQVHGALEYGHKCPDCQQWFMSAKELSVHRDELHLNPASPIVASNAAQTPTWSTAVDHDSSSELDGEDSEDVDHDDDAALLALERKARKVQSTPSRHLARVPNRKNFTNLQQRTYYNGVGEFTAAYVGRWTKLEDDCIIAFCKNYKGPAYGKWMKLMELHGPNGTVDQVLKYRTSDLAQAHAVKVLKCAEPQRKKFPKYGPEEHRKLMDEYHKEEIEGYGTARYAWAARIHDRTRNTLLGVYNRDSISNQLKKLLRDGSYEKYLKSLDG